MFSQKKIVEFTKNDIICWIRQLDQDVLRSNYFVGDKGYFISASMDLVTGKYSAGWFCHRELTESSIAKYYIINHDFGVKQFHN